uniref:MAPK/MAK/MRK overlapping kinase n=1 Tax=Lygus hesperus TaxID=30085 RepID=A0A0A9X7K2_LYGHE
MESKMLTNFRSRYKVECKIGEGSFSEVLKCKDKTTGKYVAAKQLKKQFKSAQHASDVPELIAMRKLTTHPNILHLLESHFDPLTGKVTLVFDLMDSSLYDMIKNRKKPLAEARAKNYLYQVIKGVDHIHHHGIFHRDIKPENILVKGDLLKISDLGSIKGIYNRHPYTEYISTRWYRSPECLLTTGYYGPKMDVWAIGCVFYELLTLKPLFPGSSEIDQVARINNILGTPSSRLMAKFKKHKSRNISNFATKQGTGLNTLIPFITEAGRDVLKQMLVYDPDQRINIRRLIDHRYFQDYKDLEAFQKGLALSSSSVSMVDGSGTRVNHTWKNPALLSYLTSERRRKKVPVRVKKKPATKSKRDEGPSEKQVKASCSSYPVPVHHQSTVSNARSLARLPQGASTSSVPAGDNLKAISHPALPFPKKIESHTRPHATRSLRVGVGPSSQVQPKPHQSNPALAKLKDRLTMRVQAMRKGGSTVQTKKSTGGPPPRR